MVEVVLKYSDNKKEFKIYLTLFVISMVISVILKSPTKWFPSSSGEGFQGVSVVTMLIFILVINFIEWLVWKIAGGVKIYLGKEELVRLADGWKLSTEAEEE